MRISEPDERDVDAHDSGRAQALNHAREGEHGECRRKRAGERSDREERKPPPIDAPVAQHIAERRERKERDGDRELEGVDDQMAFSGATANWRAIVGSATVTMVPSSTAMLIAMARVKKANRRCGLGRPSCASTA